MNGFPDYVFQVALPQVESTVAAASAHVQATLEQGLDLHYRSTARWMLHRWQAQTERALLGDLRRAPENILASNAAARLTAARRAIELLGQEERRHPNRRWFLVTLISDRWLTHDRETDIWLGGMKATARPVIALAGFTGWLAAVEVQTVMEGILPFGKWLLPHVHAVAWSDDPNFDPDPAEARMNASERLHSHIGARTAHISYRPDSHATNIAAYVFKYACIGKYREWGANTRSGFTFGDCALEPLSAARQNEILSQIELPELLFAGGDGAGIRDKLKLHLYAAVHVACGRELTLASARTFWAGATPRRLRHYRSVRIHRDPVQRPIRDELARIYLEHVVGLYAPRKAWQK